MVRRKKDGNLSPQKNNSMQDSVGNEENEYPVSDPNKIMINVTKEPSDAHTHTNTHTHTHTHTHTPSKKKYWNKSLRNS
jgi:hypothetical protein